MFYENYKTMKTKSKNIEMLIEKYFEGFTSLKEEQQLRKYFQRKKIPEHLKTYKPVFMFFDSEIKQKYHVRHFVLNYKNQLITAVAACLILFWGIAIFFDTDTLSEKSIAYINGKKFTDRELIRAETLESLSNISVNNTDVYAIQFEALNSFFDNN
jgi:hypothetical protein